MKPWKDRIKRFERILASKLLPNPLNFRKHNDPQRRVLRSMFEQIGIAGGCVVRELEGDRYEIIDGHLRQDMHENQQQEVPCLVTDLTAEEANALLATFHPIAAMATLEKTAMADLLAKVAVEDEELMRHLKHVAGMDRDAKEKDEPEYPIVPRFSESYNYVLVMVPNEVDWICLQETLDIRPKKCMFNPKRIGLGIVLTFEEFMARWKAKSP